MQGFNEESDIDEMICKRLCKDFNFDEDDYENISDILAWTAMFPIHKASKFGGSCESSPR